MKRAEVVKIVREHKQKKNPGRVDPEIFLYEQWLLRNPEKENCTIADLQALAKAFPPQPESGVQLANWLGTGTNPTLLITLGNNGPGWNPFTIDYGQSGNIPYSSNPSKTWSAWNITDTAGNYYGTITLLSNGKTATLQQYVPGTNGYYLEGVNLAFDPNSNTFQLTASQIFQSTPFPNAPPAQPATYTGTNQLITLSVSGANIVDDYGNPVILKGLVRPSLEWNPQGQYLSSADIDNIASWGGNVLRIDLNQEFWLNSQPATTIGSYKQIVDAIIYYATQNQMAVILDLHWLQTGGQSPMANQDSLTFWQQVGTAYKGFGTVIFELFNEPYNIDTETWLMGDSKSGHVGYQQLYDAVRSTGANNLVIVNGLDYGYQLDFVGTGRNQITVSGTNILYGSHPYNDKGMPGYTGPGGDFSNNFAGVLGSYPLIFTEFGDSQSQDYSNGSYEEVYKYYINFASGKGVHYTGFAWWVAPSDPAFPALIQDQTGTPLNGGVIINQDMKQYPATKFFNPPNNVLRLTNEGSDRQMLCHARL